MAQVVCVGDLLIDFVPTATGTGLADAPAFVKAPGGAAANVAVGLARLGVEQRLSGHGRRRPVRPFSGRHAAPGRGRHRPVAVHQPGPHRLGLRLAARRRRARVHVLPPSQRRHAAHPGRGRHRHASQAARVLHFNSISLASPNPRASSLFAADQARAAGHLVTYDVNLRLPLWPDATSARAGILDGPGQGAGGQAQRRRARVPDRQPRHPGRAPALARRPEAGHARAAAAPARPGSPPPAKRTSPPTRSPPSTPPAPATASWPA